MSESQGQATLHKAAGIVDSVQHGAAPSNAQLTSTLSSAEKTIADQHMTTKYGERAAKDLQSILKNARLLLEEKNEGDLLQRLVEHAKLAAEEAKKEAEIVADKALDAKLDAAPLARQTKDKLQTSARDISESLKALALTVAESGEFRTLLSSLLELFQDVVDQTTSRVQKHDPSRIFHPLTGVAANVQDFAKNKLEDAKQVGAQIKEEAQQIAEQAKQDASKIANKAADAANEALPELKDKAQNLADKTTDAAGKVGSEAAEKAQQVGSKAGEKAQNIAGEAVDAAKKNLPDLKDKAVNIADKTADAASDVAGQAKDKASDLAQDAQQKAGQVADKAKNSGIQESVKQGAQNVKQDAAVALDAVHIPESAVDAPEFVPQGLKKDDPKIQVPSTTSEAASAAKKVGDNVKETASDVADKAKEVGKETKEIASDVGDKAKVAAKDAKETAQDVAAKSKDVAKDAQAKATDLADKTKDAAKDVASDASAKAQDIGKDVKDATADAAQKAKQVGGELKDKAQAAANETSQDVKKAGQELKQTAQKEGEQVKQAATELKDAVVDQANKPAVQEIKKDAKEAVSDVAESVKSAANDLKLQSQLEDAKREAGELSGQLKSAAQESSQLARQVGSEIAEEFKQGLPYDESKKEEVIQQFFHLWNSAIRNPEFSRALQAFIDIIDEFESRLEQLASYAHNAAEGIPAPNMAAADLVWVDMYAIVSRWTGQQQLDTFLNDFSEYSKIIANDTQVSGLYKQLRSYVQETIADPTLLKSQAHREKARMFLQEALDQATRWKSHSETRYLAREARSLLESVRNDKSVTRLNSSISKLIQDMVLDEQGKLSFKVTKNVIDSLRHVVLPVFLDQFAFVPLPTIQMSDADYDMEFSGLVFPASAILPKNIDLKAIENLHLSPLSDKDSTADVALTLSLSAMKLELHNVAFKINKKTGLVKLTDSGLADVVLGGPNSSITVDWAVSTSGDYAEFTTKKVDVKFDTFTCEIKKAQHDVLLPIITTLFETTIKHRIETAVHDIIAHQLDVFNKRMNLAIIDASRAQQRLLANAEKQLEGTAEKVLEYAGAARKQIVEAEGTVGQRLNAALGDIRSTFEAASGATLSERARNALSEVQKVASEQAQIASKKASELADKASDKISETADAAAKKYPNAAKAASDLKDQAVDAKDQAVKKAGELKEQATKKAGELKDQASDKISETADAAAKKYPDAAKAASDLKDQAVDAKDQAVKKAGELKEQATDKAGELKEQATKKAGELKDQAADAKQQATEKAGELKEQATEKAGELKQQATAAVNDAKKQAN